MFDAALPEEGCCIYRKPRLKSFKALTRIYQHGFDGGRIAVPEETQPSEVAVGPFVRGLNRAAGCAGVTP